LISRRRANADGIFIKVSERILPPQRLRQHAPDESERERRQITRKSSPLDSPQSRRAIAQEATSRRRLESRNFCRSHECKKTQRHLEDTYA